MGKFSLADSLRKEFVNSFLEQRVFEDLVDGRPFGRVHNKQFSYEFFKLVTIVCRNGFVLTS
jgi:hypothetical protein